MSSSEKSKQRPVDSHHGSKADTAATIALLVVIAPIVFLMMIFGLVLAMGTDSCGTLDAECNKTVLSIGVVGTLLIPLIGFVASLVHAAERKSRNLRAFWVPLAGLVLLSIPYTAALALIHNALGRGPL